MHDVSIIMALSRCTVETAVNKAVNKLGFSSLKSQQMMAINEFINGRRVRSSFYHICENNVLLALPSTHGT